MLNDTFQSVFTPVPMDSYLPRDTCSPYPDMPDITISAEGIKKLLDNINPSKAGGPDGLRPRVLKELAIPISPILQKIFSESLCQCAVPDDWKLAMITPVYKKGDRDCPGNYRPISLTCICSKLLVHIVTSELTTYFTEHNILYHLQHGFRHGRSCESQLLELTSTLQANVNARAQTDLIIMDFSKAFDKVCHKKLISKLDFYGVRGNTLQWISCFLEGRQQCVVLEGTQSSYLDGFSGVPQGSVIGPTLFLVYINDLPEYVNSTVHLFADDTVMYLTINSDEQCTQLQADLNRLEEWEREWLMAFNPEKCEVLRISRKKTVIYFDYILHGKILRSVKSAKYLGVELSHNLKWNAQIGKATAKANCTLGFLKRNLRVKSCALKQQAYFSLVRPQLEYCSSIWDPRQGIENNGSYRLEMVQRRAARWTLCRYHPTASVSDMLQELGWRSLLQRRCDARLVLLYKIKNGLVACNRDQLKDPIRRSRHTHDHTIRPITCKTKSHQLSFFPRTILQWNNIPPDLFVNCNSSAIFRSRISNLIH